MPSFRKYIGYVPSPIWMHMVPRNIPHLKSKLPLCLFLSYYELRVFSSFLSLLLTWQVVPQLSCPLALFSYYNPILKRGIKKFMHTIKDVGVHGNLLIVETISFSIEPFHLLKYYVHAANFRISILDKLNIVLLIMIWALLNQTSFVL